MTFKGDALYVTITASAVRRRLKGNGYGVRRVESAGTNWAAIIHTATGRHLQDLKPLFHDAIESTVAGDDPPVQPADLR